MKIGGIKRRGCIVNRTFIEFRDLLRLQVFVRRSLQNLPLSYL